MIGPRQVDPEQRRRALLLAAAVRVDGVQTRPRQGIRGPVSGNDQVSRARAAVLELICAAPHGARLPTGSDLADRLAVTTATVAQVLRELADEQRLTTDGSGTYFVVSVR